MKNKIKLITEICWYNSHNISDIDVTERAFEEKIKDFIYDINGDYTISHNFSMTIGSPSSWSDLQNYCNIYSAIINYKGGC
jgi:hypothetical protein